VFGLARAIIGEDWFAGNGEGEVAVKGELAHMFVSLDLCFNERSKPGHNSEAGLTTGFPISHM